MSYFKSILSTALVLALVSGSTFAYAGPRDAPTSACAVKALPSVAWIKVKTLKHDGDGKPIEGASEGAGSVVDFRGMVVTNQHVIEFAKEVSVSLYGDNGAWRRARILFSDPDADLSVLQVEEKDGEKLPEVQFGPSSDLVVGEPAIVIGSPFGMAYSLSAGVISRVRVPKPHSPIGMYMIQTDASVNHGNSGGMLLNANCEQVGVVELKFGDAGIGFAITSDRTVRWLASHLSAESGGLYHGIRAVTLKVISSEGPNRQTVSVKEMAVGSPAAAVLQLGDQIDAIDGHHVGNEFDLERFFVGKQPGDEVKMQIQRQGRQMDVVLKLTAAPPVVARQD